MTSDYKWEQSNNVSSIPDGAVLAGHDLDGDDMFVIRFKHENNQIAASVTPKKRLLSVTYDQHSVENFEVNFYLILIVVVYKSWFPPMHYFLGGANI
jgi:Protein of unknown function (DUF3421)